MIVNRQLDVAEAVKAAGVPAEAPTLKTIEEYREFIQRKVQVSDERGVCISRSEINPILKPHQADIVEWACRGGRRAIFASFGLGKSVIQLETLRLILEHEPGNGLIVCPLGVRQEFMHDAEMLDIRVCFVRTTDEIKQKSMVGDESRIFLTNYESVRDGKLDPSAFTVASLDEAAILRSFGGVKTYREFMRLFENVKYRFVATATPDPNQFIELLAYSAYLDILDVSAAKTRFFKRNSTKADNLTLHPHREEAFWKWVSSWAIFLERPSQLGHSDEGYDLPPFTISYHEVKTAETGGSIDRNGQKSMFADAAASLVDAAREKRRTLEDRIAEAAKIIREDDEHGEQWIIWCNLDAEQRAMEDICERSGYSYVSLYGSEEPESREVKLAFWKQTKLQILITKAQMYGFGANFQNSHKAVFVGVNFKFAEFIQACRRQWRFLQAHPVSIHVIYADTERGIVETLKAKWGRYNEQVALMGNLIEQHGLSQTALIASLHRTVTCERVEVTGENWQLINNDCVEEMCHLEDNSIGLMFTSIPFSSQFEYSPSFQDFGHSESNIHFWEQMGFLIPHLYRVLKPGRLAVIHVKDRIIPGGLTGLGFQTVYPLHADCITHFTAHGFGYMGMKTIVTDVVRENNQTYRLGWTEQCKDGTKMGVGMPEYLMLFRKPPSSNEKSYADEPVVKSKADYSRGRWQIDAHGFSRSNGNRLLSYQDVESAAHDVIFRMFRNHSRSTVYDYDGHVELAENMDSKGRLPVTFMLLQPASWHPDVWSDIARMRTLNTLQAQRGRQGHLCPMQFDVAKRVITQYSMRGETVLDPFSGLGTVPMVAVELGRFGIGIELAKMYHDEAVMYLREAEAKRFVPTLFDLDEAEKLEAPESQSAVAAT